MTNDQCKELMKKFDDANINAIIAVETEEGQCINIVSKKSTWNDCPSLMMLLSFIIMHLTQLLRIDVNAFFPVLKECVEKNFVTDEIKPYRK